MVSIPLVVEALIEVPKGCQNKYELDPTTGRLKLDRVLYSPVHYPGEYGMVPETLEEDGDPLDILVISTFPTHPGCLVPARVLGALEMSDEKGLDTKVVAVVDVDPRMQEVTTLEGLPGHIRQEIVHFFEVYKHLENKKCLISGWHGPERTAGIVQEARERYLNSRVGRSAPAR